METIKKKKDFRDILLSIFYVIFTLSFSYVFINCFFRDISVYKKFNPLIYLIIGILVCILWYFLYKFIKKLFSK